jgi:RNase H-fold protein (predicted Holliday junction resolvase)
MRIAALDLSKKSCGWATFDSEGRNRQLFYGSKKLGSEITSNGQVFLQFQKWLYEELLETCLVETIYVEYPMDPRNMGKFTNMQTMMIAFGLHTHAESFCHGQSIKFRSVQMATWWKHFNGKPRPKTSADMKRDTQARAAQLGFITRTNDEADALGILDYAIEMEGMTPPWRANEVLRMPL